MADEKPSKADVAAELQRIENEPIIDVRFVEVIAGDIPVSSEEKRIYETVEQLRGKRYYSDMLFALSMQQFEPESARLLWDDILAHRQELDRLLSRNVGVVVAALDYLKNIRHLVSMPAMVPADKIDAIAELAVRDPLTGLFDRASLDHGLHNEIRKHERYGNQVSLIMIDIDDFKQLNDTQGHQEGDAVLQTLGRVMSQSIRTVDLAARFGGEEFAIVLPQTQLQAASELAERLRESVEKKFADSHRVTISLGVANCPAHGETEEALVAAADGALYAAKRHGKNRVVVASAK